MNMPNRNGQLGRQTLARIEPLRVKGGLSLFNPFYRLVPRVWHQNIIPFLVLEVVLFILPAMTRAEPIRAAVSIFAIGDIVHRIYPEAEIVTAIPPGADPHIFEPTPQLARELQQTEIFLGVHPDFDGWIQRILPKSARTRWFIETPEASHGVTNPHLWLSIRGAGVIARKTAQAFSEYDPAGKQGIEDRLAAFLVELDSLRAEMRNCFSNLSNRKFLQWHPAWAEFAEENGLEITGTIERGEAQEPSVHEIQRLINDAKTTRTRIIVLEFNRTSRAAETLREAIDGRIVYLDGIGDPASPERADYPSLMRFNARTLARALKETGGR
jgi:ABC-type Zn uptake system ZnuABC Zn-binding protein ZnuA